MSRVLLGVAGGIAAYKACDLVRRLRETGHDVTVVPTPSALNFVGAATWAALSGKPVRTTAWEDVHAVPHVALGREAEFVVVAPATADLLARAAAGMADDLLTDVLLTTTAPVLMVPAMHTEMWNHPATRDNVATLRRRGVLVMDPAVGRLTGPDSGPGRLPEPAEILEVVNGLLGAPGAAAAVRKRDLAGARVLVTAGGTHEPLDPVRFLGNASSGRMGIALARAAALRGAEVTLIAAHITEALPSGVTVERVSSTGDLGAAVARHPEADVVVMAAAPADFRQVATSDTKIHKDAGSGLTLDLVQTQDVLAGLAADRRPGRVVVGFAAETASGADLEQRGRAKLARKGCDLLVLNDVSGGRVFGEDTNEVTILSPDGIVARAAGSKSAVAHQIIDAVVAEKGKP